MVACYIGIVGSMQVGTDLGPVLAGHGYLTRCVGFAQPLFIQQDRPILIKVEADIYVVVNTAQSRH